MLKNWTFFHLEFVQKNIFNFNPFYCRLGSEKWILPVKKIPKSSKQGIGVHCMNTMYPIPLVGEFPNPPENEKKESVAALQHRKTGTKRSAAEIYILRKKSNLYIFRKKESLIQ